MARPAFRRRISTAHSALVVGMLVLITACAAAPSQTATSAAAVSASVSRTTPVGVAPSPKTTVRTQSPGGQASRTPTSHAASATPHPDRSGPTVAAGTGPVIVLDPGHSPALSHTDPSTGLVDSDYANEPEMRDVFAVAELVRSKLLSAGYRVVMTKSHVYDQVPLGQRAAIANSAHAALALSIHDQAGPSGGIGFTQGNNTVYYQAVGDYRQTPNGTKVSFGDSALAATSQRYGTLFREARQNTQGVPIVLRSNTGYELGSRGLAPGDIWIVQLLSKVPWIYNEAGGNSAGMSGLDANDERRYADGLVAGVESCVPPR